MKTLALLAFAFSSLALSSCACCKPKDTKKCCPTSSACSSCDAKKTGDCTMPKKPM